MSERNCRKIREAIGFTRIYLEHSDDKYIREAACVDYQVQHILCPIDENDRIAGRIDHGFIGFSSQFGGIYTYFYNEFDYLTALKECRSELTEEEQKEADFLAEFWRNENTKKKFFDRFIQKYGFEPGHNYFYPGFVNCDARVAGTNVDFQKLMDLGLDGLDAEIDAAAEKNGDSSFYQALHMWIETVRKSCERYRQEALQMAEKVEAGKKEQFLQLAEGLLQIQHRAPETLLEGVQLMWLYSITSDLMNYGRADDYLGKLYTDDLAAGRITFEGAVRLILGLYKHFKEVNKVHDCRVITGGRGRKHEKEADQMALVFMEASERFHETVPQLTLRYYKGMSEEVFRRALEVNGKGCTFPILYSDETNIPAVQKVYGVSEEEAAQYVPFGCGEYVLAGRSVGTPNIGVNLLKALEMTLHHGVDAYRNCKCGKDVGAPEDFTTYEKLYEALLEEISEPMDWLADFKKMNYDVAGEEAPYLHLSLLMDDCIARGKSLLEGGVRYLNASSEVFGIMSCADSLAAIRKVVYEEKKFTLPELVHMLDVNFEGYEAERKLLMEAPKYGNDISYVDDIATTLFCDVADRTTEAGKKAGLHSFHIVSVNNSMSAEWGGNCIASADGRKKGTPMSNGNGASIGVDTSGITALLNSMSKFDATKHVGVINNLRFTSEVFQDSMDKVEILLKTFFENGGTQANLCVIGKKDLEKAMVEPQNYQNLIVRIGGFSARFVTLAPIVQREIIARTTYGG